MPRPVMRECRRCNRRRAERFFNGHSKLCQVCVKRTRRVGTKDQRLQETYDLTHEEWGRILAAQGGVCAICHGKRSMYDTDHDHKLERAGVPIRETLRGLLCKRCNRRLLPAATDSVEILQRAIDYVLHGVERTQGILNGEAGLADSDQGRGVAG